MSTYYIILNVEGRDDQTADDVAAWIDTKLGQERPVNCVVFESAEDMARWDAI